MSLIYFHAFYEKIKLVEWFDGTATFYYLTDNQFGLGNYPIVFEFLKDKVALVKFMTWSALFLELVLSLLLFFKSKLSKKVLIYALYSAIIFHAILTILHGILPFLIIMIGVLCFYLLPKDYQKVVYLSIRKT